MPLLVSEHGGIGLDLFGNWSSQALEQVSFWSTDTDQASGTLKGIFDKGDEWTLIILFIM